MILFVPLFGIPALRTVPMPGRQKCTLIIQSRTILAYLGVGDLVVQAWVGPDIIEAINLLTRQSGHQIVGITD